MSIKDKIIMCFSNLYKRKVRTLLTTVGVVVGTCAIIITVSLGVGMQKAQEEALSQMGDLTIIQVNAYGISPDVDPLDDKKLEEFRELEHVVALTPAYQMSNWGAISITSGKYAYDSMINGVSLKDLEALGYQLTDGSFPGEDGFKEGTVYFSESSAYDFYNTKKRSNNRVYEGTGKDPFVDLKKDKMKFVIKDSNGKKKSKEHDVVYGGTLVSDWSKSPSSGWGVFVDVDFLKKMEAEYNKLNNIQVNKDAKKSYDNVTVKVDDMNNVAAVEEVIKAMGYTTNSMETIRKPMQEKAQKDQLMLGSLGAISLLVAALGIMNTMMMSIYERTREIGVMKVLGCFISDIRTVFLMEAGTIGFLGGLLGVGVSYGVSYLINTFGGGGTTDNIYGALQGGIGSTSVIPWWLVVGALLFSTLVGLLSGIYPANRAVSISALSAIKQD